MSEKLIFEKSSEGRKGFTLPTWNEDFNIDLDNKFLSSAELDLPEVSEPEILRHYVNLSGLNHHVDKGFYPLGSCTMKYNPKINEYAASLEGFAHVHPYQKTETVQGALELYYETARLLEEVSGFAKVSLQPVAGAHGEWTSLKVIRAYHEKMGNPRKKVIIPDTAHGTNPASIAMAGYDVVELKSNEEGMVDVAMLREVFDTETAAFMITNPNTIGIFERNIKEIAEIVHSKGGLLYMDGANMNALTGLVRPAEMGFDVMHFNLHKTFSTPHGGGGPGSGPIGVVEKLVEFLPVPDVEKVTKNGKDFYQFACSNENTIGKVHSFYGNYGVVVRAYTYLKMLGKEGLRRVSENAIINANYIKKSLEKYYHLPYKNHCMHEVVFSGENLLKYGVKTLDVAKRLLDFGVHAPTIYFPLLVHEAIMIEPTETESKETLDNFIEVMKQIALEAEETPEVVKNAPVNTPVKRLNEALAAKKLEVKA
ncbi:MAG: aminomethyl-transferring glycine dehydrogenase subunit GcvPB [Candidatus Delongbacteria bacterium]|nr:aminomethyl-transferring glycine dehydrogenase subunit GcvPB [Candidatus Delongbacteria bacterium]MBN2834668.1 aminomethyl-transferring glycine dehydrogenase subunit GcvPB [Candidatus Delongbacteria bacterium]